MMMRSSIHGLTFAVVAWIALVSSAAACEYVRYADNGRYVGGNLITQIARKANTIQIVTVTEQHLVSRSYTRGWWFLNYGNTDVPPEFPEYTDYFAFRLDVVETLKIEADDFPYNSVLRLEASDVSRWNEFADHENKELLHPNQLPPWFIERPGDNGYAFVAEKWHGQDCNIGYVLEVGQQFVALRDSSGRLYPASGRRALELDVEFGSRTGQTEQFSLNMQSLIPISGPDDPFVLSLRAAIGTDH